MAERHGPRRSIGALCCGLALACALPAIAAAPRQLAPAVYADVDGEPLPLSGDDEILDFLSTAEIVDSRRFEEDGRDARRRAQGEIRGDSYRMILERDGLRVPATLRTIDDQQPIATFSDGSTQVHFRDYALFDCAAYQLARLLGVSHVAPAVERRYETERGCLQIDIVGSFSEAERIERERADPSQARWNMQLAAMNVFDTLIANIDRTQTNLRYDSYWRVWLTDHTRSFRIDRAPKVAALQAVEATLWSHLESVPDDAIRETVAVYLTAGELAALLDRRRALVEHYRRLIAERGAARVVYSY